MWQKENCIDCGDCIKVCRQHAISRVFPFFVNRHNCKQCFKCVEICPSEALKRVGQEIDIDSLINEIIPYKPYFQTSGGGVTISGGEPALFAEFVSDLLIRFKNEGIHTLIETAGQFNYEKFESLILPYVNSIFFDIKLINSDEHKKFCGIDNKEILNNFISLYQLSKSEKFKLLPRTPLIPGITDTKENILNIVKFYNKLGVKKTAFLTNNPVWFNKKDSLGQKEDFADIEQLKKFYDEEKKKEIIGCFTGNGIEVV